MKRVACKQLGLLLKVNIDGLLRVAFLRVLFFVEELKAQKVQLPLQPIAKWTKFKTMQIQTQQVQDQTRDRAVSPIKVQDGRELYSQLPLQMPEQQIHTISSISGRTNSLSTIQEVSSARYQVDSTMQCQTFVEAQQSNQQSYHSQDVFENESSEVIKSPTKQHHKQTPSISHIQQINLVEFPVEDCTNTQDRSRTSATFDIVESRSPTGQLAQEVKETRIRNYIRVEQPKTFTSLSHASSETNQAGFLVECSEEFPSSIQRVTYQSSEIEKRAFDFCKSQGESSSNLDFNLSHSTHEEKTEASGSQREQGQSVTPRSTSKFRKELTERLRSHAEGKSREGFQQIISVHNALLSPASMSARTSQVSNPTKAIGQRKLNFMREQRSPNNLHNSSELAEPIEFAQVSTTPRQIISKPESQTLSHRHEIVTPEEVRPQERPSQRARKYNHKKFIEAIANACQKYAVEVLTFQKREVKEKAQTNIYSAELLRESILNDLRERRQRVLQRSREEEITRSSKEIKPPSYPKGLLEYSLNSIEKSSRQNTPKRAKRHYSALALNHSNSQHLSLSQCSSKKSIPSIEIDLRQQAERIKTEGWQEPEQRMKQAQELARKILGFSSKSKVMSQKREARKEQKQRGHKNLRVHSHTMSNLRTQQHSVESLSNYSSVITPKSGSSSMESSYFFKQMKAKYLAQKKIEKSESINYIKRNIESVRKLKGEQGGKKKILKCNH